MHISGNQRKVKDTLTCTHGLLTSQRGRLTQIAESIFWITQAMFTDSAEASHNGSSWNIPLSETSCHLKLQDENKFSPFLLFPAFEDGNDLRKCILVSLVEGDGEDLLREQPSGERSSKFVCYSDRKCLSIDVKKACMMGTINMSKLLQVTDSSIQKWCLTLRNTWME